MAILASWQLCQCLQRMMENVEAIDFSAADDWRVLALWRKDLDQETETLSKALAALHEAEKKFKGEGRLPQDEAECDELFELLFSFGPDADPAALLAENAESGRELETRAQTILETRNAMNFWCRPATSSRSSLF